jgi:hypothetical protein
MKSLLKLTNYFLLLVVIIFASCKKEKTLHANVPLYQPASIIDPLRGQEFFFNDLTWEIDADGTGLVIVSTPNQPIYFSPDRSMEVSIKLDTSAIWISVPKASSSNGYEYLYGINLGYLFVYNMPSNNQLAGTKVSIRVKFF